MLRTRTRKGFRRSRLRERVCAHLRTHGRTDHRALMRATGLTSARLDEVLFGGTDRYRALESPIELGIVRVVRGPWGQAYELTPRGAEELLALDDLRAAVDVPL